MELPDWQSSDDDMYVGRDELEKVLVSGHLAKISSILNFMGVYNALNLPTGQLKSL